MRALNALLAILLAAILSATAALGQTPEPPPPQDPPPQELPPSVLSQAAGTAYDRPPGESLPNVNVYLPEFRASVRLRKLIRNVLFETQLEYEFGNGDISTYLRYKYYARNYTYRLGVFDSIEFPNVGEGGSGSEFERVRGALALIGVPRDYNRRYFWLIQGDSLSFGQLDNVDNKKKNFYTKVAYQFGTQFDERLNAIAGETRGRITPVLTAFRGIGPQRTGYAVGLTLSPNFGDAEIDEETGEASYSLGDYRYVKFETEGLRRFDVTGTSFVFSRLHVGAFFGYEEFEGREMRPEVERFSVPRYEMFRLGGREALRAIDDDEFSIGTHEIHLTNEFFTPIFRNRDYKTGALHWNTLYGIAYVGAGSVGVRAADITKSERLVADVGIGAETALTVRDFEVLLSIIYAQTVKAPDELEGSNIRFSIRTIR
jgi:hypothetical protein